MQLPFEKTSFIAFPNYSREFILDTDASDTEIGCVLSQKHKDGLEHVVAYGSQVLSKAARYYCVTRYELLAACCLLHKVVPALSTGKTFCLIL